MSQLPKKATLWYQIVSLSASLVCATASLGEEETISVLTLNVAGLPNFLTAQDNPEDRMRLIAKHSKAWDIVAYQEDFVYSEQLDEDVNFKTLRGEKFNFWSIFVPWLRKSGLTVKTSYFVERCTFQAFDSCSGYFGQKSDCWVPKGILCARIQSPLGLLIDFCTTHLDAGNDEESHAARREQIKQYNSELPRTVTNRPWIRIETGDYNLRLTDVDIRGLIENRDEIIVNTETNKNVDFITVTANHLVKVRLGNHGKIPEFDDLSDHPAVGAVLHLSYGE